MTAKKKAKKKITPRRKVSLEVESLIHHSDEHWAKRVGELRGECEHLKKKVAKLSNQLSAMSQSSSLQADKIDELYVKMNARLADIETADSDIADRLAMFEKHKSALAGVSQRLLDWEKNSRAWTAAFYDQVVETFKAAARHMERRGERTAGEEAAIQDQLAGAFSTIRSGLTILERELEVEEKKS